MHKLKKRSMLRHHGERTPINSELHKRFYRLYNYKLNLPSLKSERII